MNGFVNEMPFAERTRGTIPTTRLAGSRADLIQAIRGIGGRTGVQYFHYDGDRRGIQEIRVVFVSCSREKWERIFGRPESIADQHASCTNMPLQTWVHSCVDGPVTCVGHLFSRSSGIPWVVLARIAFYP